MMLEQAGPAPFQGKDIYKRMGLPARSEWEGNQQASQRLNEMGIPGMRYADAGSRAPGQRGSHNYVMFGDKPVRMLKQYSSGGKIAQRLGRKLRADGGDVTGWGSVGEAMPENIGRDRIVDPLANAIMSTATLPKRTIDASYDLSEKGQYDPAPFVEAATLLMGSGAFGAAARSGEALLGSGPVRRIVDDTGAAMKVARGAKKQKYAEPEFTEGGSRIINKGVDNPPDPSI